MPNPAHVGSSLTAALAFTLLAANAAAVCLPADPAAVQHDLSIRAQVLVVPNAARPYLIARCFVSGDGMPRAFHIPINGREVMARIVTMDASWDQLWEATAPRAIVREMPSARAHEPLTHDLDPPVAAVLGHPEAPIVSAAMDLVEVDDPEDLPAATQAVLTLRLEDDPGPQAWLPWVHLPLRAGPEGGLVLPVLPVARAPGGSAVIRVETSIIVLGTDRYYALSGFDLWEAIDREPGTLREVADRAAPNPVLAIPDLRVEFNAERRGGFEGFYSRRVDEVAGDAPGPVALLQYAGGLGGREGLLPQPDVLDSHTSANRVVRLRLDSADGTPLHLVSINPTLYLPVWVSLPDAQAAAPPVNPQDATLSGETLLFTFGAELPSELTPTLVRGAIESNIELLMQCDPGAGPPLPVDLQLMVESGGTTLAVFVRTDNPTVAQCLIDALSETLFPLARGAPVAIRFPIVYQNR